MNLEVLRAGYRQILQSIYAPRPYYRRIRTFLREYRAPARLPPLQWTSVVGFANSWFRLPLSQDLRAQRARRAIGR